MFVHYGLFSLLGRGEWVMNRERIPPTIPVRRTLHNTRSPSSVRVRGSHF